MMLACLVCTFGFCVRTSSQFYCFIAYLAIKLVLSFSVTILRRPILLEKMQFTLILGKDTWPFVWEVIRVPKALCFVHLLAESHCKFISDTWFTINISYIKSDVWAYYCSSCHVISVWVTFVHTCFKAQLYRFLWSHTSIAPGIYNTRHISLNSTTIQLINAV